MDNSKDFAIRPAIDGDVNAVKSLFVTAYGEDYPFKQFYHTSWLKKAVFDDDTLFLVAHDGERIVGTISTMLTAGNLSDLIGEFGRLVVHPEVRGKDLGTELFLTAMSRVSNIVRFAFAEARTAHSASQRILERSGFVPLGFEPLKYKLQERESVVMYGKLIAHRPDLRRNHPRLIPEAAPLAMHVLDRIGLIPDVVVVDEENGYPMAEELSHTQSEGDFEIEDLSEQGWSPLLRIERGRVKGREVFGNLSLSHGFFKIKTESTRYLMAREDGAVLGGLGFTHDPIDRKANIFELIGITDAVKGRLLREAERIAREDLNALYLEADVNAYTPAIQRTLERMGFMAVAYCPSMVFEHVERLDVVRMAKMLAPYFREDIRLTEASAKVRDLVERSMDDRREGKVVAEAARATDLFRGLDEGDMYHLARLGRLTRIGQADRLIRQGEAGDRLFIVVSGAMQALIGGKEVGRIGPGETVGEMALLDAEPRSADVLALQDTQVVEILRADLVRLMERRPRLGTVVMRNLATDLAEKLRNVDARYAGSGDSGV
jgi:CRP-like cAMP-binding protein/GNAT superfamily N-acetyltransferase